MPPTQTARIDSFAVTAVHDAIAIPVLILSTHWDTTPTHKVI